MGKSYWGIQHWQPHWYSSSETLLSAIQQSRLIGNKIKNVTTLWDDEEFFSDAPVILSFEEHQLELCALEIDKFSLTLDIINTDLSVSWCDEGEKLKWHKDKNAEVDSIINHALVDVGVIEYSLDSGFQEVFKKEWVLHGVYFKSETAHFEIFNALDCNGLSKQQETGNEYKYISIAEL